MMRMAWQYLKGRKLRTALTTLAIVFGVGLIFMMNLVLPSAEKAFEQSLDAESEGVDLDIASPAGEAFAPEQPTDTLRQIDGVEAVTGVLRRRIILPKDQRFGDVTQIELIGVDLATVRQVQSFDLSSGRFVENSGEAVVAHDIGTVGETINLVTTSGLKPYTIVGVLKEGGMTPRVFVSLADAQADLNQPGLVNLLEVSFKSGTNEDKLTSRIKKALGDDEYLYNASSNDEFAAMQAGYLMFSMFGVIALFLGGFLIFNTFRTVVIERRRDLAMLRAIGATRRQLMQMILIESLLQGIIGTLVGLVLGYLMALGAGSALRSLSNTFYGQLDTHIMLTPKAFMAPIGLGMLCTLLAGYWPARRAGRTSPLEALRPSSGADIHRAARWGLVVGFAVMIVSLLMMLGSTKTTVLGSVLFLVGMVIAGPGLVVPAARLFNPLLTLWFAREGDLARGNMVRQPGRAAITASTLMIGLATFVMIAASVLGFNALIDKLIDTNFSSDIMVMPTTIGTYSSIVGADENLVSNIRGLPDVEQVAELRHAASVYDGNRLEVYGIDPQVYPEVSPMDFSKGDSKEAFAKLSEGRNAIVNPFGAAQLGFELGDTFTLQTSNGPQTYRVVGIATDLLNFKIVSIFISQENLKTDFNKTEAIMMMIDVKPGADVKAVHQQVKQMMSNYPQFLVEVTSEYRSTMQGLMSSVMNAFYILAALILIPAALGLLNTLTINVLERTREIGIVRAVGGSRKQVQRIVVAEALLLGLLGAAIGVLSGVALSYGFTMAFGLYGWEVPYIFPVMGIVAAIIIALLLALFSSILPARNAAKLDIIRALQYE